jgi:hypothetical protein
MSMLAGTAQRGTMGGAWEATSEELGELERLTAGQKAMLLALKTALLVILCCEDELVVSCKTPHCLLDNPVDVDRFHIISFTKINIRTKETSQILKSIPLGQISTDYP